MKSTHHSAFAAVSGHAVRASIVSAMMLLPAVATLAALPTAAIAQPSAVEVRTLAARTDGDLEAGSRLSFRAEATPRAQVTLRLRGVRERIALRETAPGTYVGRYTVKRSDAVEDDGAVRVFVKVGSRTASVDYTLAEVMDAPPRASARAPAAVVVPPPQAALRIDRFTAAPVARIEPGEDLQFALDGAPGATVVLDLPGVAEKVALRELRPGHYEGSYTLRRADNLVPSRPVVATLRVGERAATANLTIVPTQRSVEPSGGVVAVNLPLQIMNQRNNGTVDGGTTMVEGRTAPFASVEVKVDGSAQVPGGFSVSQHLFAQTIQADANGGFSFSFSPRFPLPGSRYEVVIVATKAGATKDTRMTLFQR